MTIDEESLDGIRVLVLEGRLDSSTCDALGERMEALIAQGEVRLLLDCAALGFVSSAGLRVILVAARQAKAAGGSLSLCGLQPPVQEVFDLSGFSSILAVHPDRASILQGSG